MERRQHDPTYLRAALGAVGASDVLDVPAAVLVAAAVAALEGLDHAEIEQVRGSDNPVERGSITGGWFLPWRRRLRAQRSPRPPVDGGWGGRARRRL